MKILFVSFCLLFSAYSYGRTFYKYVASIQVKDENILQNRSQASGWRCSSLSAVAIEDHLLDNKGEMVSRKEIVASKSYDNTLFVSQPNTSVPFSLDFELSPFMVIALDESCVCDETPWNDRKGLTVSWICTVKDFPKNPDEVRTEHCNRVSSNDSSIPFWDISPYIKSKDVIATIKFLGTESANKNYNCPPDAKNKRTLRFSEGLGGHIGEDDFEFQIRINGGQPFISKSIDGLASLDLDFCPKDGEENVNVEVSAIERDLIWDDLYCSESPGYKTVLSLNSKEKASGSFPLIRKRYLPKWAEKLLVDSKSTIKIDLIN